LGLATTETTSTCPDESPFLALSTSALQIEGSLEGMPNEIAQDLVRSGESVAATVSLLPVNWPAETGRRFGNS